MYIEDGMSEHIINGNRVRMKKGSILIMDSDCVHSFENVEITKYYNLLFKPGLVLGELNNSLKDLFAFFGEEISDKFIHIDLDSEYSNRIEMLLFEILKEFKKKNKKYVNFIKIHISEIINIIMRIYESRTTQYDTIDAKFSEALEYIKNNCCGDVELKTVAEKFGYSHSYFSYLLKKYFGLSFKQLVIKKRLEMALYCLNKEESTISDIARKCGFSNKTYFYELFEKQFGMKPKEVRKYWADFCDEIDRKIEQRNLEK